MNIRHLLLSFVAFIVGCGSECLNCDCNVDNVNYLAQNTIGYIAWICVRDEDTDVRSYIARINTADSPNERTEIHLQPYGSLQYCGLLPQNFIHGSSTKVMYSLQPQPDKGSFTVYPHPHLGDMGVYTTVHFMHKGEMHVITPMARAKFEFRTIADGYMDAPPVAQVSYRHLDAPPARPRVTDVNHAVMILDLSPYDTDGIDILKTMRWTEDSVNPFDIDEFDPPPSLARN